MNYLVETITQYLQIMYLQITVFSINYFSVSMPYLVSTKKFSAQTINDSVFTFT